MTSAPPKTVIPLDYRDLAQWAETAGGLPDEPLVIAEVEENGKLRRVLRRKSEVQPEQIVVDGILTRPTIPAKRQVTRVFVEVDGKQIECTSPGGIMCDAVFCTDSAIEKFLFLYYQAQRLLTEQEWKDLHAALRDPEVVAIGHIWPSSFVALRNSEQPAVTQPEKKLAGRGSAWRSPSRRRSRVLATTRAP